MAPMTSKLVWDRLRADQEPASHSSSVESSPPSVRIVKFVVGGASVLEVRTPMKENAMLDAFRALRGEGLQLAKTEVRPLNGDVVQRLHLLENDGASLTPKRLSAARRAVLAACRARRPKLSSDDVATPVRVAAALACA
ncbi:MAG TPA: hypothetical protein VH142_06005 [Polyangiaceae bacterium]|jgi:2-hydroxychromene-2-carboxylate isomerase|nr:hypothetical protein [Polyangiaceae bacterium]